MTDRHVLMFAHWFPPCMHAPTAAARAHLLARQLPEFGWRTTVIAPQLQADACDCPVCPVGTDPLEPSVIRIPVMPSVLRQRWIMAHTLAGRNGLAGLLGRGARAILRALLLWREADSDWVKRASETGQGLLRDHSVDMIWTTSNPYVSIAIGDRLKRATGVPWVADLRDPVSVERTDRPIANRLATFGRQRWREPLRRADRVVAVTDGFAEVDRAWLARDIEVIRSGFDPTAWSDVSRKVKPPENEFRIVYAGSLHRGYREPFPFLEGLRAFLGTLSGSERASVRFRYYGSQGDLLLEQAAAAHVSEVTVDHGLISPDDAREAMAAAHVLVLLTNLSGDSDVPGGKFYEYLAARRPILAVPDVDSTTRRTIDRLRAGACATEPAAISQVLHGWFSDWRSSRNVPYRGDETGIDRFSARSTATAMASLLNDVVSHQARSTTP